jgi:hypothetical protein
MANYKKTRRHGRSKRQKRRTLKRNNRKSRKVMRGGWFEKARMMDDDGTIYSGIWDSDNLTKGIIFGNGNMRTPDGITYNGTFINNKLEGYVEYTKPFETTFMYQGYFKNGVNTKLPVQFDVHNHLGSPNPTPVPELFKSTLGHVVGVDGVYEA